MKCAFECELRIYVNACKIKSLFQKVCIGIVYSITKYIIYVFKYKILTTQMKIIFHWGKKFL